METRLKQRWIHSKEGPSLFDGCLWNPLTGFTAQASHCFSVDSVEDKVTHVWTESGRGSEGDSSRDSNRKEAKSRIYHSGARPPPGASGYYFHPNVTVRVSSIEGTCFQRLVLVAYLLPFRDLENIIRIRPAPS